VSECQCVWELGGTDTLSLYPPRKCHGTLRQVRLTLPGWTWGRGKTGCSWRVIKLVASHFTASYFSAVGRSFNTNNVGNNNIVMSCASVYPKEEAGPASQAS